MMMVAVMKTKQCQLSSYHCSNLSIFVSRSTAQPESSKTRYLNVIGIDLFGVV